MKFKHILLTILLVLPVCFFLFLQTFAKNHYDLPIYYPIDSTKNAKGKWDKTYHKIRDFEFTNQDNKPFGQKNLKGNVYVVDFFFTKCGNPTLCPRMSTEMKRVQDVFKKEQKFNIVSITVDPENDTPETLQTYAKKYEANTQQWHFLTAPKKDIYHLAYHDFKINAGEETETEGTNKDKNKVITPEFMHATKFILVDTEGRIRGYYDGTSREEVDKMMVEAKILLYQLK